MMLQKLKNETGKDKSLKVRVQAWAKHYKREITAIMYALKHEKTPWYAKVLAVIVVGYALSPIDFIPDFIPVIGYLDDLLLLPLGIALTIKLIPKDVFEQCREQAEKQPLEKGRHLLAAAVILSFWLLLILWIANHFFHWVQ